MNIFIFKPHIHDCVRASCAQAMSREKKNQPKPNHKYHEHKQRQCQPKQYDINIQRTISEYRVWARAYAPPSTAYFLVHSFVCWTYYVHAMNFCPSNLEIIFVLTYQQMDIHFFLDLLQLFILYFGQRIYFHFYRCCFDYTLNVQTSVCESTNRNAFIYHEAVHNMLTFAHRVR